MPGHRRSPCQAPRCLPDDEPVIRRLPGLLERSGHRRGVSAAAILVVASAIAAHLVMASAAIAASDLPTSRLSTGAVFSVDTTPIAASSTAQYTSSPFVSDPSKRIWYRIPAIITNAEGHLLAFAEKRDNDTSDMGNFDVVMRRSTDGGRTWGILRTIANDGANRVSNPVPVLDPTTGDVLLITSVRYASDVYKGIFLQRSTDGGTTFTPLASSQIRPGGSWKGGLTGPGHGIVLTRGVHAGRVVVAMGYKRGSYYGAYGIYSDDGGATWRTGYDQADTSGAIGYIEGTIAELPDGRLYIDYRDKLATTPGRTRLYAHSSDGGSSLSSGFRRQGGVKIHSVEGSALAATGTRGGELFFSAPAYTSAADRTLRRDMGIFLSRDGGVTWRSPYHVDLDSRPAAYSDLVQLDDARVGILYETGTVKWRERIRFRAVRMSEISTPTKVASTVTTSVSDRTITTAGRARVRVRVTVAGITSPPGTITVIARKNGTKVASSGVTLTYSNKGLRYISLPRLRRGTYTLYVSYSGTGRIAGRSVYAGRLWVR